MNKIFGLFLLALVFLAPNAANAVNCFWVGGTGTWDASSITHWAPTTGAAATGCQTSNAAPAAGDTVTFDANSGGGTVTPTTGINGIAFLTINAGAFTSGTLAFNTNNPTMTSGTVVWSGSSTRSIDMGSGTWTITATSGNVFDVNTATGLTATFSNAPIVYSATTTSDRTFRGGGQTYNSLTINSNSSKSSIHFNQANTFSSITVSSGNILVLDQLTTTTITGALTMTGTSSLPVGLFSSTMGTNIATISVGSASTMDWAAIFAITESGAGTITATNSLDLGKNTNLTITPPSVGGGGGRIIGG